MCLVAKFELKNSWDLFFRLELISGAENKLVEQPVLLGSHFRAVSFICTAAKIRQKYFFHQFSDYATALQK